MNAILKYPGGKWRISDWIINHFPEHKVYLEPFFGSGAVFFNKSHVAIETINDINGAIVNLFKVCRDNVTELAKAIYFTPFSRNEYIACSTAEENKTPIEWARQTLVRYWQSFGTSNSSLNSWKNSQTYNSPNCAKQFSNLPDILLETVERLKNTQIECMDGIELIKRYSSPETLIYIDPPYLLDIRKKNIYENELQYDRHIELLETILESKSKIIISAYDNDLYNKYLDKWSTDILCTTAQMGLKRQEKLYINFNPQISIFELLK